MWAFTVSEGLEQAMAMVLVVDLVKVVLEYQSSLQTELSSKIRPTIIQYIIGCLTLQCD